MASKKFGQIPPDLAQARLRFQVWRNSGKRQARIPEPLWALAVKLAQVHGVCRTAAVLKLDYYSLKNRLIRPAVAKCGTLPSPAFIELPAAQLSASADCVIELQDGVGASLRISLQGYDAASVSAMGRALWEAARCSKSPRK